MFPIGFILLLCVVMYASPSASVLGAVLLTGCLGGAVATHVRVLIAGYVMVSAESLEDAGRWATRYIAAVQADEVDLRELEG